MKIKNANSNLSLKSLPIVFVLTAIISIAMRAYQMIFLIDNETGFFLDDTALNYSLYVVLGVSCLFFIIMSYINSDTCDLKSTRTQNKALSAITYAFATLLFIESALCYIIAMGSYSQTASFITGVVSESNLSYVRALLGVFSGIYFIIVGNDYRNNERKANEKKVLALAPVAWVGFKLMSLFSTQISFLRVSDLVLELIMLAFFINFFLSYAQFNSNVYRVGYTWRVYGFGLSASLISLSINVPRLVLMFVNSSEYINADYSFNIVNLICAIFAIILIFSDVKISHEEEDLILKMQQTGLSETQE
ncbi:MAG: hypothetical protein R3Y27_03585 [Clostridia bacterium]